MKILVGVTSCSLRKDTLLPRTLASLRRAGFSPDRIFADGVHDGPSWEGKFGTEITTHWPTIGPWGNWWLGINELWMRSRTSFDLLLMAQDDFKMALNTRQFIEECFRRGIIPEKSYLNLYTFPHNYQIRLEACGGHDRYGWFRGLECKAGTAPKGYQRGLGAVALVFTREGVETLLRATTMINKSADPDGGYRKIDGAVVNAMNSMGWQELVVNPSLVQHLGNQTSISGPGRPQAPHPQSPCWVSDDFDAMKIFDRYQQQSGERERK